MTRRPRQISSPARPTPRSAAILLAAATMLAACGGRDNDDAALPSGPTALQACDALNGTTVADANVTATELVAATATAVEYCKVTALIAPQLNFEVRLPSNWNQKLHYSGGGGYNGAVGPADLGALEKGFADVSSDSGHQENGLTANFALNDPNAASLFGYLSVPTVMAATQAIVTKRYGQMPTRNYFEGCSNGGREALMNAQRFPTLFDGIIARAPAYNWTALMGAMNRNAKAVTAPGGYINAAKTTTLANAVLASCDANDGVADGIVSNPQACTFDPATLRCAGGADTGDACLSDAQLASVTSWTTPALFAGGAYRNAGWKLSGNENVPGAWDTWFEGATPTAPGLHFLFSDTTVKNYLAKDPNANSLTYDYDSNPGALFGLASLNDSTNPDLRPFQTNGGKLILWHGENDSAISYRGTVEYYQQVIGVVGGQSAADAFTRLYLAPGVNHCAGGPGADQTDLLAALDAWVGAGTAPSNLVATRFDATSGAPVLARPLCAYPNYPRYSGSGDVNAAASYACTAP